MEEKEVIGVKPKILSEEVTKTENYGEFFTLIEHEGKVKIATGRAIISKLTFDNMKDAKKYIDQKPWELIINLVCYVNDQIKQLNKE